MSESDLEEPPDNPVSEEIPKKLGARALRAKDNKLLNEFVIKCSLNQGLNIEGPFKEALVKNISGRVEHLSKMAQNVSIAVNIMVRECIERSKSYASVEIPLFLTEKDTGVTFLRQIATDGAKATKAIPLVDDFLERNRVLLPYKSPTRFSADTNSIVSMVQGYITNYRTFIETTFKKNQEKYIGVWLKKYNYDPKYSNFLRYKINNWDYSKLKNKIPLDYCLCIFVQRQQEILGISEEKVSPVWVKNNYEKVIVYYAFISKFFIDNELKAIRVAPLCKMKSASLYIDTSVLYGVLKECKLIKYNLSEFKANIKEIHEDYFKAKKLLTNNQVNNKNFKFTGIINTDGTTINFHYRRPKLIATEEKVIDRNDPCVRVIANDPGRKTLFYGVEELASGGIKTYIFSRNKFYDESGSTRATKKCNKWNEKYLKNELAELSTTNSRSLYLKDFLCYTGVINKYYNTFWDEYSKKKYSRQRFNLYSNKKRSYDNFFKSLDDNSGRQLVIAFGDAGFASTAKHELAAPTTTLEKECKKWYKVIKVDEFRTTQLYCDTGAILTKIKEHSLTKDGKAYVKTIRGLLMSKTSKFCKFIDRDLNAAKNIMKCYRMFPLRPPGFNREDNRQEDPVPHFIVSTPKKECRQGNLLGTALLMVATLVAQSSPMIT
jgi:hypothetical protein